MVEVFVDRPITKSTSCSVDVEGEAVEGDVVEGVVLRKAAAVASAREVSMKSQ